MSPEYLTDHEGVTIKTKAYPRRQPPQTIYRLTVGSDPEKGFVGVATSVDENGILRLILKYAREIRGLKLKITQRVDKTSGST